MLRIVIWNIYFANLTDALYFLKKTLLVFITAVLFILYVRTVLKNQACNIYMYHTYNRKLRVSNLRSSLCYILSVVTYVEKTLIGSERMEDTDPVNSVL